MNLLCLGFGHDGLAAVFKDRRFAGAVASERFTRIKKHRGVNRSVVNHLLQQAGLMWSDIDLVVVLNWFFDRRSDGSELFDKAAADVRVTMADGKPLSFETYVQRYREGGAAWGGPTFHLGKDSAPCVIVDHHFSHCAYSYYMSPFDSAVALSVDGADNIGARYSIHLFDDANKTNLQLRRGNDFRVGGYYASICDFLGFYPSLVECGKVMALAAYGKPVEGFEQLGDNTAPEDVARPDILISTLMRCGVRRYPQKYVFEPPLKGEGGQPDPAWLNKNDWKQDLNRTLAATAQAVLEKSILEILAQVAESTRHVTRNLVLSGGTMLNCVCNGKILHSGLFENVFVAPACSDDGGPIGGGLYIAENFNYQRSPSTIVPRADRRTRYSFREAFEGGPRYSMDQIRAAIERLQPQLKQGNVSVRELDEAGVVEFTSDQVIASKIVGWFYRGSELGPRALGHRSLLANPRNPAMKDILNHRVKHREEFRPFAPVIPLEVADQWFDLPPKTPSPFMLFSVACKKPDEIPSAVHIDGTARVQTVDPENNGRFYDLVKRIGEKTGVPIVLNTSFNVQGEPIVETPDDAIRCFLGTEIDVLVLERFVLEKPKTSA